jgi:hypothetical protein
LGPQRRKNKSRVDFFLVVGEMMKQYLPDHYVLTEYDVYCGRGNDCYHHPGNQIFRSMIRQYIDRYHNAISKYDKSFIIDTIVTTVRQRGGNFVKKEILTGRFYEVGDYLAVRSSLSMIPTFLGCFPNLTRFFFVRCASFSFLLFLIHW